MSTPTITPRSTVRTAHLTRGLVALAAVGALAGCDNDPVRPTAALAAPRHDVSATSAASGYLPATTITFEGVAVQPVDNCGSGFVAEVDGVTFSGSFFLTNFATYASCNLTQASNIPSGTTAVAPLYNPTDPTGTGSAPKQIGFPSPVARVQIQAASLAAGTLAMAAYDRTGREVARVEKPAVVDGDFVLATWVPLTIERAANDIAFVRLFLPFGSTWVDDLSYARLAPAPQAITITSTPPAAPRVGGTYAVTATSTGAESPITFSAAPASVCTVGPSAANAATVTLVGPGTCTVAADQAASPTYTAAPQVTQTLAPTAPTAQAITFTSAPPAPALLGATYAVSATGGASGNPVTFSSLTPAVCTVAGNTVSFAAVGSCRIAADQAGNGAYDAAPRLTQSVAVVYRWTAFLAPVNNLPTVNVANAGRSVPLKFTLGGNQGLAVLAAGSPSSQQTACATGAATGTVDQTDAAGGSALSYDAATGQYTYVWKTDKAWAGTCRTLTLKLSDGTEHTAGFQFTR